MHIVHRAVRLEEPVVAFRNLGELMQAFECACPLWAAHGRRVAAILERALRCLPASVRIQRGALLLAARLHDVGYLLVPEAAACGRLSAAQLRRIRERLLRIKAYWTRRDPASAPERLEELARLWVLIGRLGLGGLVSEADRRELERYSRRWVEDSDGVLAYLEPEEARALLGPPKPCWEESSHELSRHVLLGVRLLESLSEVPQAVVRLVAVHHERADGSGLPEGLRGRELGFWAQLLIAADLYDAHTGGSRDPAEHRAAFALLDELARAGKLDVKAVSWLKEAI
ncbi:MAG: HD domain-containing phosphohydrolase [Bacteroidota bacterium]|nr:hypothetical protein [Bacteroidota bacterium]MDW8138768.1 HD domain-containing phosphohydrolase [Bacteroidota bacterium]